MPKVIVTVVNELNKDTRDFEIPSSMKVRDVAEGLAEAFQGDPASGYQLKAYPLGRVLELHESLDTAGVWDGALLVLSAVARPTIDEPLNSAAVPTSGLTGTASPVVGWRALDAVIPKQEEVSTTRQSRGFVWKRLD